ncbi:hypothetical protein ABZW10_23745 [Kitasatospora sp. NPDC004723]|uniref:hypothetical protein n=1 Tax=Kitasatospora sp. NPDC004723 TaxID=3154288 RepID=UPI0033A06615
MTCFLAGRFSPWQSGVDPTLPLIERLAAAFDSAVRIDPAGEPAIRFEAHAA